VGILEHGSFTIRNDRGASITIRLLQNWPGFKMWNLLSKFLMNWVSLLFH
jgi:hypothetical protein